MATHTLPNRTASRRRFSLYSFYVCLQMAPIVLSRALPTSLDGSSMIGSFINPATPIIGATKDDVVVRKSGVYWFKCTMTVPVDETAGLACTTMGHDSLLQERSPGIPGSDPASGEVTSESIIEDPSSEINLYPCFFESSAETNNLLCEATGEVVKERSENEGLQTLVTGLMDGLPVFMGPELINLPEFDSGQPYSVFIYPTGGEHRILVMNAPHSYKPLKYFAQSHEAAMKEFISDSQKSPRNPSKSYPPVRKTVNTEFSSHSPRPENSEHRQLQIFFEGSLFVRCWFQVNTQKNSPELYCAANIRAGLSKSDFDFVQGDSESDSSDSDFDDMEPDRDDDYDSESEDDQGSVTVHVTGGGEYLANNTKFKRQSQTETFIDRWFFCWPGSESGSKMFCEIPDWYTIEDGHDQSRYVRKATLKTHGSETYPPLLPLTSPVGHVPVHFLVDSPPIWQHCRFIFESKPYGMECVDIEAQQLKSGNIDQGFNSVSPGNQKRDHLISDQPAHNMTCFGTRPAKASAFGKMGDTFAFIGFFTVVAVFTIVLVWLVKHLFFAVYDGLEEWTDSRRRKRKISAVKDFGINDGLDMRAPSYESVGQNFQHLVGAVTFSQPAAIVEETPVAISTTGSQAVEGSSDSVKRKKAALRATVSEGSDS